MIWVLLQSESPWQRNDAIIYFVCVCVSLYQEFFFKKSLKGVWTSKSEPILYFGKINKDCTSKITKVRIYSDKSQ